MLRLSKRCLPPSMPTDLQSIIQQDIRRNVSCLTSLFCLTSSHFFLLFWVVAFLANDGVFSWSQFFCFYVYLSTPFSIILCQKMVFTPSKALSLRPVRRTAREQSPAKPTAGCDPKCFQTLPILMSHTPQFISRIYSLVKIIHVRVMAKLADVSFCQATFRYLIHWLY